MYHPPRYSEVEGVPLQDDKRGGFPLQPACPGAAQAPGPAGTGAVAVDHTTVTIVREDPKDHVVWSLAGLFFANVLCLGLAAFICSIKARDRKILGDIAGAKVHGSKAYWLNVVNTTLMVLLIVIVIVLTVYRPHVAEVMRGFVIRRF